jgi:PilZ domain
MKRRSLSDLDSCSGPAITGASFAVVHETVTGWKDAEEILVRFLHDPDPRRVNGLERPVDDPRRTLATDFPEDGMNAATNLIGNLISRSRFRKTSLQKDRRQAKRHRMDLPARFRICLPSHPELSSAYLAAQVFDLSKLGIGLLADRVECGGLHIMHPWPATSEQCLLEIKILNGDAALTLHGRAAWYSQQEEGEPFGFRIGIKLVDLSPELDKKIRELIELKTRTHELPLPSKPEQGL